MYSGLLETSNIYESEDFLLSSAVEHYNGRMILRNPKRLRLLFLPLNLIWPWPLIFIKDFLRCMLKMGLKSLVLISIRVWKWECEFPCLFSLRGLWTFLSFWFITLNHSGWYWKLVYTNELIEKYRPSLKPQYYN